LATTAFSAWMSGVCSATMCFKRRLVLELFQPLHLTELHPAVFRFPAVVRLLGDTVGATQIRDPPASFAFP
jgi:hypothetical protein